MGARRPPLIPAIHDYCDRRCEHCAFVPRCGVGRTRDRRRAPDTTGDIVEDVTVSFLEMFKRLRNAAKKFEGVEPPIGVVEARVGRRADDYSSGVIRWLRTFEAMNPEARTQESDPRNPFDVVAWFAWFIPGKIRRAFRSRAFDAAEGRERWPDAVQTDANGSAKIAIIAIDRSLEAWESIAARPDPVAHVAARFRAELAALREDFSREFPDAPAFIRPGFDKGWLRRSVVARPREGGRT
jgi:hypothetical protein